MDLEQIGRCKTRGVLAERYEKLTYIAISKCISTS